MFDDEEDGRFCDCECACDKWDKAQMRGQLVMIVLFTLLLSFMWTDGWGTLRGC